MSYYFLYNGASSEDYGLKIKRAPVMPLPTRDVFQTHVTGRSGDLIQDLGSYQNITISVEFFIKTPSGTTLQEQARSIKRWLTQARGYQKLMFSDDPDYYYLAAITSAMDIEEVINHFGQAILMFTCKPHKYRVDGQKVRKYTEATTKYKVINPESEESEPQFRINGTGDFTLYVNSEPHRITGIVDHVIIDSEFLVTYKLSGSGNAVNQSANAYFLEYPKFKPGRNTVWISGSGTLNSIEIIPRWRAV